MRHLERHVLLVLPVTLLSGFVACVFTPTDYRALQGDPCTHDVECLTGHCNEVCCDRPCDLPCEACIEEVTGVADGACAPLVLGALDPDAPECDTKGGCGVGNKCGCGDGYLGPGELGVDCGGVCEMECMSP